MIMKYMKFMKKVETSSDSLDDNVEKIIYLKMGDECLKEEFNFSDEEHIINFLREGDTLYDVEIPKDVEVVELAADKYGNKRYMANTFKVTNPRFITEEVVLELYQKSELPEKAYYQLLAILAIQGYENVCRELIKDKIQKDNIKLAILEYKKVSFENDKDDSTLYDKIFEILQEIESDLLISIVVEKEPYTKTLTSDNVINLTGQSGAGKSYYANQFDSNEYLIIDTDDIFSNDRFKNTKGINKELGIMFRDKYHPLPNLAEHFDLIYQEILNYCQTLNKTIVIDCAQFHCVKDVTILKGKIIILRTSITTCYNRCIERYQKKYPNCTKEELEKYKKRKSALFSWYKGSNEFIKKIDQLKI